MSDQSLGDQADGTKKGYSIWSLLVIMTLLAFWFAMLKQWKTNGMSPYQMLLCFTCHQLWMWTLVGTLIWLLLGKPRAVLYLLLCVLLVVWGPMVCRLAEYQITGTSLSSRLIKSIGVGSLYTQLYDLLYLTFGYGPSK